MSNGSNSFVCQVGSWAMAAAAAALTLVLLMLLGGWNFWAGVLIAALVFLFLGLVLGMILCRPLAGPVAPGTAGRAPGDIELSARAKKVANGGATPVATAAPTAAAAPAPTPEPAPAPAPKPAPAAEAAPAATEGEAEGTKPETLSAARGGKADNLKEIKGVGPKLEKMLNEMGFYHFDQIAKWTADELAWVNANLTGFKGRASRDNWIEQAKILAAGGETEFSKRVEDGDVY